MHHQSPSTNSALLNYILQAKADGYTADLKVSGLGLHIKHDPNYFNPSQVVINDSYRFALESDPSENSILYLVETADGKKGILVNACGTYADPVLDSFIKQIQQIAEKNETQS